MSYGEVKIIVGQLAIKAGVGEGKIWLERASGPAAGEGGDFDEDRLADLLLKFYEENF